MLLALQMFLVSMTEHYFTKCHLNVSSTLITSPEKSSLMMFCKYIDSECHHE